MLAALLLAGCETPQGAIAKRIEKEHVFFAGLPEDTQERLRNGQLQVGDPMEAARIVYGAPARTHERITATATNRVWSYMTTEVAPMDGFCPVSYPVVRQHGRPYWATDLAWHRSYLYSSSEYLRIEFRDNTVVAIDLIRPHE